MRVINFQDANCAHCYKCLRNCQVKAIRIKNGQAQIVRDMCVYCGHCMEICPQEAKTFDSDLDYVKDWLAKDQKIVASLDPSYRGLLGYARSGQIVSALKELGFYDVRQTAEGADLVTKEYVKLIEAHKMDNIITTQCTSLYNMVEKHYPMLIPYLAPVVSPMVAHGRYIKKLYGEDTKVVFIGPCVAKKMEAEVDPHTAGAIDAVIEFKELENWLEEIGIDLTQCALDHFGNEDPGVNQLYPVPNGISRSVRIYSEAAASSGYKFITITHISSCREFLHSMREGDIHNCFVEMHVCDGGCVNGPGVVKNRGFRFKAAMHIEDNVHEFKPELDISLPKEDLARSYVPKQVVEREPSEAEIKEILKTIGKSGSNVEFNCGACGYLTCRDKAIAIYQGKAEADMCIIRSYENARSQASIVLRATPNMIIMTDGEMKIREFNRKAESVFDISRRQALQSFLFELIPTDEFEEVYRSHASKIRFKKHWDLYDMYVMETIVYVPEQDRILAIIEDITDEIEAEEKRTEVKLNSVKLAQSVIEKQMTTAQQIAGLLGETTAETKAILTQIRDNILEEEA